MRAERQTESIADITGNDVQVAMKYFLARRLAVRKSDIYSFTSDAALTQHGGDTLRDTEHMRAFFFVQLRKVTGMSIRDYERMPGID